MESQVLDELYKSLTHIPSAILGSLITLWLQWLGRYRKSRVSALEAKILVFAMECGGLITRDFPEKGTMVLKFEREGGPTLFPITTQGQIYRLLANGMVIVDQHPYTYRLSNLGFQKAGKLRACFDWDNPNRDLVESGWRRIVGW